MFEFLRNSRFDADNYSFTTIRNGKDPYKRNQYGFALGGPVRIPKVFNGSNRLFFLANFESVRDRKALRQIASVPSLAMRGGDFSSLLPRTIYNPATRTRQANGAITAQPFGGNIIPASLFHPKAVKLLEFYPLPNVPGTGLSNNYQAAESRRQDADQFTTRIDLVENSSSTWFGRYSHDDEFQISPSLFPRQGYKLQTSAQQALISNTRILTPSLVNEFRFSYSGFHNQNLQYNAYVRDVIGELGGIAGIATPTPKTYGTPAISITGLSGFGENSLAPFINNDHIFQWVDNLSINIGKHSLRTGVEIRRDRFNTEGNQHPRGSFSFQGQATQNPAASANTGYGFADYLLGQVRFDDGALGLAIAQLRSTSQAYFIDDSWKIRSNVTISLGLRYEYTPPYSDKYSGALINVDLPSLFDPARRPTLVRSGKGGFYEGLPFRFDQAIQIARDGRLGDRLLYPDRNDFAPRIGLAYSPSPKWTLRSGFGVFYVQDIGNTKFDLSRNLAARREDTSSNDFPDLTLDVPFRGIGSSLTVSNPLELAVQPHTRTPYILQYLLNVQRQITNNLMVEIGYLGNEGHKLQRHTDYNAPLPGRGSAQANRPYPELGIVQYTLNSVNSNYNSLAAKLQQRFSHGVSYLVSYTFSKSIDNGSAIRPHGGEFAFPQNPYSLRDERGRSEYDQRHRLVTSILWDLPAGKGRHWMNHGGPIAYILGGWQLGGILTTQSGLPFTPVTGSDVANIGWAEQRPNYTGASLVPEKGRSTSQWFNRAAFALQPAFTFGNAGRNILTGPRLTSLDFSATKQFRMPWEGHQLQFRFEAFNLPNHPNFNLPSASIADVNFGRISSTATDMRQIQFALKYTF